MSLPRGLSPRRPTLGPKDNERRITVRESTESIKGISMSYVFIDGALMGGKIPAHHGDAIRDWLLFALPDLDMRARGIAIRAKNRRGEPMARIQNKAVYGLEGGALIRFWSDEQCAAWMDAGAPGTRTTTTRRALDLDQWKKLTSFVDLTRWAWTLDPEQMVEHMSPPRYTWTNAIRRRRIDPEKGKKNATLPVRVIQTFGGVIAPCAEWMDVSFYTLYDATRPDGLIPVVYVDAFVKAQMKLGLAEAPEEAHNAIELFNNRRAVANEIKVRKIIFKGA